MKKSQFQSKNMMRNSSFTMFLFVLIFFGFLSKTVSAAPPIGNLNGRDLYDAWGTRFDLEISSLKGSDGVELANNLSVSGKTSPSITIDSFSLIENETYTITLKAKPHETISKDMFGTNREKGILFILLNEKDIISERFQPLRKNNPVTRSFSFVAKPSISGEKLFKLRTFLWDDSQNFSGDYELENEFIFQLKESEVEVHFKKQLGEDGEMTDMGNKKFPMGKPLSDSLLPKEEIADYTFLGWYKEGEDTLFNLDTPITESVTLVAKYSPMMKLQYEPQAENIEIFYKEEVKEAKEYLSNRKSLEDAKVLKEVHFKNSAPDSSVLGSVTCILTVVYMDNSSEDVAFSFTIKPLKEKYDPSGKNIEYLIGNPIPEAKDFVETNVGGDPLPANVTFTFKDVVDWNTASALNPTILVTYEDNSVDEVNAGLSIKQPYIPPYDSGNNGGIVTPPTVPDQNSGNKDKDTDKTSETTPAVEKEKQEKVDVLDIKPEETALGDTDLEEETTSVKEKKNKKTDAFNQKDLKNETIIEEEKTPLGTLRGERTDHSSEKLAVTGGTSNHFVFAFFTLVSLLVLSFLLSDSKKKLNSK